MLLGFAIRTVVFLEHFLWEENDCCGSIFFVTELAVLRSIELGLVICITFIALHTRAFT